MLLTQPSFSVDSDYRFRMNTSKDQQRWIPFAPLRHLLPTALQSRTRCLSPGLSAHVGSIAATAPEGDCTEALHSWAHALQPQLTFAIPTYSDLGRLFWPYLWAQKVSGRHYALLEIGVAAGLKL